MHIRLTILFFLLAVSFSVLSQVKRPGGRMMPDPPVCYASPAVNKSFIPPPPEFGNMLKSGRKNADIIVNYIGFPDSVRATFEYAVSIWESLIYSSIPIYMEARWQVLSNNVLGSCGPGDFFVNFDGAPHEDVYYPVALVEKLRGEQLTGPGNPDMIARFNSTVSWYYGTDGKTPVDKYDLVSTVLHEIAHGLGFTGFFRATTATRVGSSGGSDFLPAAYDIQVMDFQENLLVDTSFYPNPSNALFNAFTSNILYSSSFLGSRWNNKTAPRLYAPTTFNEGSSLYHLNTLTYGFGNPNSLMTHSAGKGEAIHSPGPITMGILGDMGWNHMFLQHDKVKDTEQLTKPLEFSLSVRSDNGLDSTSVKLVYSLDTLTKSSPSVKFNYSELTGSFTVSLLPELQTGKISYYITATDTSGREFTIPDLAPAELYIIQVGPDLESPRIDHTPPAFILSTLTEFIIEASVTDNLGLDTVYAAIYNNGTEKGSVPLLLSEGNLFAGMVNLRDFGFSQGGKLEYILYAVDRAAAGNLGKAPAEGKFGVEVEQIFKPINGYFTDFDSGAGDFIQGDFSVKKAKFFDSSALHSPNPYPSPEKDNESFDLVTMLRYPVIVKQNGIMSFDEVVLVEPGENGTNYGDPEFWDYVIVEASKDFGDQWFPLLPGYDSGSNSSWLTSYNSNISGQNSRTLGNKDLFINRQINLTGNGKFREGDTILVRFRLYSDPYANGWGWVIDNLRIQQPVSAPYQTEISPGHIAFWPNPFSDHLRWTYTSNKITENLVFEIFDLTGRIIFVHHVESATPGMVSVIPVNDIPPGLCVISVKADGIPVSRIKVLKK